mgnify:CR=1 FL=1
MQVARKKLHGAETSPGDEAGRPDREHAPPAGLGGHEPERHQQGEERQLAADHRAEIKEIEAGERGEGDQRRAERPERNRGGVADQREFRGFERTETEPDHERAGDRDRRAEAGGALDEGAERKRDQQRLNAPVARDTGDLFLKDGELAGFNGELVDEDRVEDQPADGQQAEGGAIAGGREGERGGHTVGEDRGREREEECRDRGEMRADVPEGEQPEQRDHRNGRQEGGQGEAAERGVVLGPSHGVKRAAVFRPGVGRRGPRRAVQNQRFFRR